MMHTAAVALYLLVVVSILSRSTYSFVHTPRWRQSLCLRSVKTSGEVQAKIVFLGNLPFTSTEDDIRNIVKQNAGDVRIKSVTIATGKKSKAHRGFCFIDFHNAAEAIMVADSLDGAAYEDRVLNSNVKEVVQDRKKVKKERRDITKSVFVANLDRSLTEFEVSDMCEDLLGEGVVKKIDMPIEKQTGRRRGIAYIEFFSEETVEKAIEEFTDLDVLGRLLICTEVKDPRLLKKEESD